MHDLPAFEIQDVGELRLGAQHVSQALGDAGASGRYPLDVGLELRDLRLDLDEQRIRLNEARIPQGDEDPAWPQNAVELVASFVEIGPVERRGHADKIG